MATWTTYGTWLQGNEKKYVKDGEILQADKELEEANKRQQKSKTQTTIGQCIQNRMRYSDDKEQKQ